jgi:hypothetical protein
VCSCRRVSRESRADRRCVGATLQRMSDAEPEPEAEPGSRPSSLQSFLAPGERMPWVLRQPARDTSARPRNREADRTAALEARRTALLVVPAVGLGWLLVAVLGGEDALRIATITALVVCVALGVRASITTQRFRRRWMDPKAVGAPPVWVTLVTVAAAIAAVVAVANVISDIQADRSAVRGLVFIGILLAIVGIGAFAHVSGGRSVGAALRRNDHVH